MHPYVTCKTISTINYCSVFGIWEHACLGRRHFETAMCVDEYFDKSSHTVPCLAGCIYYVLSCVSFFVENKTLSLNQKAGTTACQMSNISE